MQIGHDIQKKITFNYPPLYLHYYFKANLTGMVLGWFPFKIVSINPTPPSRFPLLLKKYDTAFLGVFGIISQYLVL